MTARTEVVQTPFLTLVVEVHPETARPGSPAVSVLDPALLAVVLRLLRSLDSAADRPTTARSPVLDALAYAEAHYAEPLTVGDLARRVGYSPSAFSAQFRDLTGRAPYQFLKDLRLERAKDLLVDGGATVASVAHRVGYTSVSHFIKEFRTRFGATPRAYAALRTSPVTASSGPPR